MARKTRLQQEYEALYPDCRDIYARLIRGEDLAAIEKRLGSRPLFQEVRPAHLRIAETDQALRSLLGAPETLPLTQWYMEVPVKGRRLAGCQWRLVGTLLPAGLAPEDRPPYPFFQHDYPEPRCLQVWLWRVFKPRPPPHPRHPSPEWFRPFGDIRWHPERGVWIAIELNADDGPAVARQVGEWVHASGRASRGRPPGTGAFRDRAHLEGLLIDLIREHDRQKPPISASQRNLARFLMYSHLKTRNLDVAEQTLRDNLDRFGLDLDDVRRRAREPGP
jgi:hypothetical protein